MPPPSAPFSSFSYHFVKFPSYPGFLNPALNLLPGDGCPQSYSGGSRQGAGSGAVMGLFPVSLPSWMLLRAGLPTAGGEAGNTWDNLPFPGCQASVGPGPEPGPAHLHEVRWCSRALQVICRCPGSTPTGPPDDRKDKLPLASILTLFAYRFLPRQSSKAYTELAISCT